MNCSVESEMMVLPCRAGMLPWKIFVGMLLLSVMVLPGKAWEIAPLVETAFAAEATAAAELGDYMRRAVPSGEITVGGHPARFVVGDSAAARSLGWSVADLPEEEWHVRALEDGTVVLIGGGPRGTFYAVCHFLEDRVGIRWWTFNEE